MVMVTVIFSIWEFHTWALRACMCKQCRDGTKERCLRSLYMDQSPGAEVLDPVLHARLGKQLPFAN